jgi:hypothetical protein
MGVGCFLVRKSVEVEFCPGVDFHTTVQMVQPRRSIVLLYTSVADHLNTSILPAEFDPILWDACTVQSPRSLGEDTICHRASCRRRLCISFSDSPPLRTVK